jgi:hypothetical protein
MSKRLKLALALAAMLCVSGQAWPAVGRTFVASYGGDSNTSVNCAPTAPCRSFAAAMSVTASGGEVVVLDSAGYGPPITITQSVSITAPEGVYAGITVASGAGVSIATAGVVVTLTGLTMNGTGAGSSGIRMSGGAELTVDHCTFSNFSAGYAIYVDTPAALHVTNTLIRDSRTGLHAEGGATAVVSHTQILRTPDGIESFATAAGGTKTTVQVTDSVISGIPNTANGYSGALAYASAASETAVLTLVRSTISNDTYGVVSESTASGATALVSVSDCLITGISGYGLFQDQEAGSATLASFGNNTFYGNAVDQAGTITSASVK